MKKQIDFYDIYDYYYKPFWQSRSFKLILLSLFIICFTLGVYFLISYLKKRREQNITSSQWAFNKLNFISLKNASSKKDFKKFYFNLTSIVKGYLQKRFDWFVQDKTDDELITFLQKNNFDEVLLEDLKNIKKNALWVKFADETVLKVQAEKDLKSIYGFVEKTKQNDTK